MPLSAIKPLYALAHETRWRIAERLREDSFSAADLAEILQLPRTSVSDHLQIMRNAGLLVSERWRRKIRYRLSGRGVRLILCLRRELGITDASCPVLATDAWNSSGFSSRAGFQP